MTLTQVGWSVHRTDLSVMKAYMKIFQKNIIATVDF